MPIFDYRCPIGHVTEHYVGISEEVPTQQCWCSLVACKVFSPGIGRMLSMEEGKEQVIRNLEVLGEGNESTGPVRITSPDAHRRAMKRAGVREVTASDYDKLRLRDRAKTKPERWF